MIFTVLPSSTWDLRLEQNIHPKSFKRVQTSGRRVEDTKDDWRIFSVKLIINVCSFSWSQNVLNGLKFHYYIFVLFSKILGKRFESSFPLFVLFVFADQRLSSAKTINISLQISVFLKHRFEDRRKCHCRTPYVCVGWRFILKLLSECETIFVFVQSLWLSDWRLLSRTNLKFDCNISGFCL